MRLECISDAMNQAATVIAAITLIGLGILMCLGNFSSTDCSGLVRSASMARVLMTENAIELFELDHGRLPERFEELVVRPANVDQGNWPPEGYLGEIPLDGWGRRLGYKSPGTDGRCFDLFSLGADGKEGGDGLNADLTRCSCIQD